MQTKEIMLCLYCDLPASSSNSYCETQYQNILKPIISALKLNDNLRISLYCSGPLLRWLESAHPEFIILLGELIAEKQVELVGGAYYATLLPLLPPRDSLAQVEMLTSYIRATFHYRPRALWLNEYAWEQGLVPVLRSAGAQYTFLHYAQFERAGLAFGQPCITEEQGETLIAFPVFDASECPDGLLPCALAYERITARYPELTLVNLCYSLADIARLQAEWGSAGLFPNELAKLSIQAPLTIPSSYLKKNQVTGLAYFMQGAHQRLFPSAHNSKVTNFKQILLAQASKRLLYAKLNYVRLLSTQIKGDKIRKKLVCEEILRAQNSFAHWVQAGEGDTSAFVYGQLGAYHALISAERMSRTAFPNILSSLDIDFDGQTEFLYQGSIYNAYVHREGASIFELDILAGAHNHLDSTVLSQRAAFFADSYSTVENNEQVTQDLRGTTYTVKKEESDLLEFTLVPQKYGDLIPTLGKCYHFKHENITVVYYFTNSFMADMNYKFSTSFDFLLDATAYEELCVSPPPAQTTEFTFLSHHGQRMTLSSSNQFNLSVNYQELRATFEHSAKDQNSSIDGTRYPALIRCTMQLNWTYTLSPSASTQHSLMLKFN